MRSSISMTVERIFFFIKNNDRTAFRVDNSDTRQRAAVTRTRRQESCYGNLLSYLITRVPSLE